MGEYAEMEIFAQTMGKNTSDLSLRDVREFYQVYDGKPVRKSGAFRCEYCNKVLKSMKALHSHTRDKHGKTARFFQE